ncbi:MAG: YicC family protein [Alphaproteobacteria bacterium]|nr:YicC family protein [Alphaproteobacteria bacterium]
MNISSMTGFARVTGNARIGEIDYSWFWELKSVNGKSLEVKTKLPFWLDAIALTLKNKTAEYLSRGNVYACLDVLVQNEEPKVKINEQLLQQLAEQALKLYQQNPDRWQKPNPAELLNIRGVVEVEDSQLDEEHLEYLQNQIVSSFVECLNILIKDRQAEGNKIVSVLSGLLIEVESVVKKIENIAINMPERLKAKLMQQLDLLLESAANQISEERLAQEMVLLVNRADIKEETDRLNAHIKTAKELLQTDGAVGRRLDFLCQELNRETNTICSKSTEIELTNCGMQLKTLIEQFREQVQNIE